VVYGATIMTSEYEDLGSILFAGAFLYFKMFIFTSIFKHNGISNLPLITSSTEQERQTDTKYARGKLFD